MTSKMKNKFIYLLFLMVLGAQAQTIPSYKNIKLTATAENPSATKIGTIEADKTFGYIQKSDLLDVIEVASAINLPSPGVAGKIYVTKDNNKIYRWNGTFYDQLAVTDISGKVDKIAGKGLSTEDYTTAEKTKLAGLSNFDPTAINNTLATKVDKVAGKGLSTEDYTTVEKSKLAGIQAGATANSTDAQLRDRATHTGTQAISTVIGLQAAIDAKINLTLIGANNGVTPLDPGGKVPFAYLPASLMIYKGMWNPATNTPTLSDGTGVAGWVYKANASGNVDLGSGNIAVVANDFIIHNGTKWEWSSGTDDVVSVNGQQGVVSLNTSHIPEVTNKRYQTDAQNTNNNATSPIQGQLDSKQSTLASSTTNIVSGNTLQRAALTGDVSAPLNSNATTLATVNSNVGTFGNASNSTTQTVNAKGLTTSIANVPIQIGQSQVTGLVADLDNKFSKVAINFVLNDDLDNFKTAGLYGSSVTSIITSLLNKPVAGGECQMKVEYLGSSTILFQTFSIRSGSTSFQEYVRTFASSTWSAWQQKIKSDGTGATGNWNINITGNAVSATKLQTPRNINGVPFDGTADITVADATKLPLSGGTLTGALNGTSATFSSSVTAPTFIGSLTGNATTATAIASTNVSDANSDRGTGFRSFANISGSINFPAGNGVTMEARRATASVASVGTFQLYSNSSANTDLWFRKITAYSGTETWSNFKLLHSGNFGTTAGTVAEGNDSRILNGQTAFGWGDFRSFGLGLGSQNVTDLINGLDLNARFFRFLSTASDGVSTIGESQGAVSIPFQGGQSFVLGVNINKISIYDKKPTSFTKLYDVWSSSDFTQTNITNWNTTFSQSLQWNGGATNLVASTGRTSLGGTTIGQNFFTLVNPSAVTFPRINVDNTVSALDAATFRTAIGAGTSSTVGTVTSIVAGNGLANGTITSSGTITLGTPTSLTLSSTNTVTATSHSHAFTPGGTAAQYITGAGTLATFPTIPAGTVTNVSVTTANGISGTVATNTTTPAITLTLGAITPSSMLATGLVSGSNLSGTNTGDNAVNSLYSGLVSNATHTGEVTGATALTITNGAVTLAKMANVTTGTVFYRKTASTGVPEVQTLATLKTDLGLTGINTGDQTTITGNAGSATVLQTPRNINGVSFNGTADITVADATKLPLSGGTLTGALNGTSATLSSSVTASGFFQSSDRRLKYIHKRDGDVAYFTWKDGRDDKMHIGWIAQEVRKQFPDQVQKNDDGYLSVSYIEILVAKNRELERRLESLEERIEQLEKSK